MGALCHPSPVPRAPPCSQAVGRESQQKDEEKGSVRLWSALWESASLTPQLQGTSVLLAAKFRLAEEEEEVPGSPSQVLQLSSVASELAEDNIPEHCLGNQCFLTDANKHLSCSASSHFYHVST